MSCQPYARARRAATGRAAAELWGLCARPPAIEIGRGGLVSLTPGCGSVRISSLDLSKFSRRVNHVLSPYARARRAATGRAAAELWGLCARPPAIEIGRGGLVSLTPGSARYEFRVLNYRNSAAALTMSCRLTRARGAPPRVEPQPSYGVSARGRPRSRLAGGAWSRSLQAAARYKFRVLIYRNSAAALTMSCCLTRARGAPPRVEPQPSYGVSARGRPRSRLAGGAWSRSRQARLGTNFELWIYRNSAAALTMSC